MLSREERLLLVAWNTELASQLAFITHSLGEDEMYTKKDAVEELIKVVNRVVSDTPKIY
ncbi:hypothetical protein QMA02_22835 [Bacillus wiedmannii]|uniref:hypothetical protein n=1 Tax=Bacillus wiedmannii TaxID=1890302 RepID=UPI0008644EE7|nr:hypothetical protein [Bacillus wiedmannii]MBZ4223517.1 hypothetical protein [Bacillus wiedmannii]MDI6678653.1 hypothetical protein [Bacillus wiedmannii]SCN10954.1 Uncharacterized protein BCINRASA_06183 [Bacillus wiedmannii]HDR3494325.1 hypothetical protein [Bacillus wiedmannii]